jgi:hypothetical protein
MLWEWRTGLPRLSTINASASTLELTTGDADTPDTVPRLETTSAFRTLGVYISPFGSPAK